MRSRLPGGHPPILIGKENTVTKLWISGVAGLVFLSLALTLPTPSSANGMEMPDALQARIEAMKPDGHVWRDVRWETCLLKGLTRAREENKPVLLWVFLHNPNMERC